MTQETPEHQSSQPGTQDGERCDSEFIRQAQAFADWIIVCYILDERHSEDNERTKAVVKAFFDMLRRRMNNRIKTV